MPTPHNSIQLFDVKTTAQRLSVSPQTVRRLIKEGSLKSVRIGDRVLCSLDDLENFIASSTLPIDRGGKK